MSGDTKRYRVSDTIRSVVNKKTQVAGTCPCHKQIVSYNFQDFCFLDPLGRKRMNSYFKKLTIFDIFSLVLIFIGS